MKSDIKSDHFLKQMHQIRQLAMYFAVLCMVVFMYLDFMRFSGELLKDVLTIRVLFQAIPISILVLVCKWQQTNSNHKALFHLVLSIAVILIGYGHAEILVTAHESARYFPKVGLVIILYYAGIILIMPLLHSVLSSLIIIAIAATKYHAAGIVYEEVLSISVFYAAFAACCLIMNVVCSQMLRNNLKLIKHIDQQANTDNLTQLCNRRYFFEKSVTGQEVANREAKPLAIMLVDLDHFKQINDNLGHDQGDCVLIQTANVLRSFCKRPLDIAARFGGDEFVLMLYDADEQYVTRVCTQIIEQIESISQKLSKRDPENELGVSVGVVMYQKEDNFDIKTLIKIADSALYEVKKKGKNDYQIADKTQFKQSAPTATACRWIDSPAS